MLCFCVTVQIRSLENNLKEGDVILSNHPCAGGSHLPDLTVITPVSASRFLSPSMSSLVSTFFFTNIHCFFFYLRFLRKGLAAQCFSLPAEGTMLTLEASLQAPCPPTPPPFSRRGQSSLPLNLSVGVSSRKRVREGAHRIHWGGGWKCFIYFALLPIGFLLLFTCICISAVTEALMAPAQYPDCSGTRNLHDNLSDLRAQVAANQRGSQLVGELIDSYGLSVVQAYMGYIQVSTQWNTVKEKQRYWCALVQPSFCCFRVMQNWRWGTCWETLHVVGAKRLAPWRLSRRTSWTMAQQSDCGCRLMKKRWAKPGQRCKDGFSSVKCGRQYYNESSITTGQRSVWLHRDRNRGLGQLQCSTRHHPVCPHLLPALHGRTGHPT